MKEKFESNTTKMLSIKNKYRNIKNRDKALDEACYDILALRENLKTLQNNYDALFASYNELDDINIDLNHKIINLQNK